MGNGSEIAAVRLDRYNRIRNNGDGNACSALFILLSDDRYQLLEWGLNSSSTESLDSNNKTRSESDRKDVSLSHTTVTVILFRAMHTLIQLHTVRERVS